MHPKNIMLRLKQVSTYIKNRESITAIGVAAFVLAVRSLGFLQVIELFIFDQFFVLRPLEERVEKRIVLVTIDEGTVRKERWPLSDEKINQSLQKLKKYQPKVIGLHLVRDLDVEPGTKELEQTLKQMPNVVGIKKVANNDSDGIQPHKSLPPQQVGFNNLLFDPDGKIRRNLLYLHHNGRPYESFALRIARLYFQHENITPTTNNSDRLRLKQTLFPRFRQNSGSYVGADDNGYQIISSFPKPKCSLEQNYECTRNTWGFPQVSFLDLINDRVPPSLFRNKIVLIGTTASSLQDLALIPYSSTMNGQAENFTGVELQAFFLSELIAAVADRRALIKVWPDLWEISWIFLWSSFGSITWWRSSNARNALLTSFLLLSVVSGGAFLVFVFDGWWIPIVPAVVAFAGTAVATACQIIYVKDELKRSTDFLHQVINAIADPVYVKDRHHRLIVANQAYCQLIGHNFEDLIKKTDYSLFPAKQAKILVQNDKMVLESSQSYEHEEEITSSWNETLVILTKRSLHRDAAGNHYLVGIIHDITQRKQYEEGLIRKAEELHRSNSQLRQSEDRLRYLAFHDPLTGLANRKLFMEQLQESIEWSRKNSLLLGLMFIDLDGFKQVNDVLGHEMGDRLLVAIASRVNGVLRSSDTVARLGGDEFTVILRSIPKVDVAEKIAEKILFAVAEPVILDSNVAHVSASIGISIYPFSSGDRDTLIRQADSAMYRAKHYGKNRYEFA